MTTLEKAQRVADEINRMEKELGVELYTNDGLFVQIDAVDYAFEFDGESDKWVVKTEEK